ncbi:MAG: DUF2461 domain-containing protein [Candidatus Delongbacteria bacterium]|nr:DUF2461 domain-containing protein [Candidatus Delongbacteria bacterium]
MNVAEGAANGGMIRLMLDKPDQNPGLDTGQEIDYDHGELSGRQDEKNRQERTPFTQGYTMISPTPSSFRGFYPETIPFFIELKLNDSKSWYQDHKEEYKKYALEPFQRLVEDLSDTIRSIDPELDTTASSGRAISRIYRDIRFSKDKSLYRENMWITFKRRIPDWQTTPAFFFELTPNRYRFGMGYYLVERATMENLRRYILEKPTQFSELVSQLQHPILFSAEGNEYKRPPVTEYPEEFGPWIMKKEIYLCHNRSIDDTLYSADLVEDLKTGFKQLEPWYHFFHKIRAIKS